MTTVVARRGDGYSAVAFDEEGSVRVALDDNHPGVSDPAYRRRRDAIAALAVAWQRGEPLPRVDYRADEHATWRTVCARLQPLWRRWAVPSFVEGAEALDLPAERVPQLDEVSAALEPLSGFSYLPVAGLAPLRSFYLAFGEGVFWSTQYLRHHSTPLYTPEPDLCHEVLGHANQLADPRFARLYRSVAAAAARTETPEALAFLSKVFWYTIEFGITRSADGRPLAYGAGLLSSFGELQAFHQAESRPIDWAAMGTQTYDITHYQAVLYQAPSLEWLFDEFDAFLAAYDDDTHRRLTLAATRH
jgi:phenylalanine-4-hydroxylase